MNWMKSINLSAKKDLIIVLAMLGILVVLFTPIPAGLLDFLLILNFSFGILVLMLTFYSEKPLDFSTFPSLLLITTLFRLSLNIAATRLILDGADAGEVIHSVGTFVVGGNYVIGMVVFLILVVVQYVVVTNGAQRVAEVAARFTLDSMPGKQMSIDADLNMGLIDEQQAKERRAKIEKEANFYGAMDGASKFVKGDAIAGIIIILIDIIGGLSIGIVQNGLGWSEALHTYTLLTVGDGIVTQIPSLVIAVSTGIIITRAATDSHLGDELISQVTSHPKTLVIVSCALLGAAMLPGIPLLPTMCLFVTFAALAFFSFKKQEDSLAETEEEERFVSEKKEVEDIEDIMDLFPLEVALGNGLTKYVEQEGEFFKSQLEGIRKQFARQFGIVVPEVKLNESFSQKEFTYSIAIEGIVYGNGTLYPEKQLAINAGKASFELEGEKVTEPAYQLPAIWIDEKQLEKAKEAGYTVVEPKTLLLTHFNEILKNSAAEILSRKETERIVNRVKKDNAGLLEELIPNVMTFSDLQGVLRELLSEKVSIRPITLILESLLEISKSSQNRAQTVEYVRKRLASQIVEPHKDQEGNLSVLTLAPKLERNLIKSISDSSGTPSLVVEPSLMQKLINAVSEACEVVLASRLSPVIVCAPQLRKPLKQFLDRILPNVHVLSMQEIPSNIGINTKGSISLGDADE